MLAVALVQSMRTPRGGRLCAARRASQSRSNVARSAGGVDSRIATDFAQPLAHQVDRHDLRRQNPRRFVVALELPFHQHQSGRSRQVAVLLERLREHHDLDAAGRIVEHEHAHAIAFARLQRAKAGDDAADGDFFATAGHCGRSPFALPCPLRSGARRTASGPPGAACRPAPLSSAISARLAS